MGEWTVQWQILRGVCRWREFKTNWNPQHEMYFVVEEIAKEFFMSDNGETPWPVTFFVKIGENVQKYSVTLKHEPCFYVQEIQEEV